MNLDRLQAQLLITGLQQSNNALYQVISNLITSIKDIDSALGVRIEESDITGQNFLTSSDETVSLPNSKELVAGTNVSFDDSTPGQRIVDATGGVGDVVGPSVAIDNDIAVFDGITGKIIKDGAKTISALDTATATAQSAANSAQSTANTASSGVTAIEAKTVLTVADETALFPNSRRVLAGSNVTFDDTVPGERTVNAAAGSASAINQLTGDVTAGPGSGSVASTLANTAVTPGSYTVASLTVDAKGRLTAASNGTIPASGPTEQTTSSTGTQNNFSLSAAFTHLQFGGGSSITFTGFSIGGSAPAAGNRIIIENLASQPLYITNEDAGSIAANRILTINTLTKLIGSGGRAELIYDGAVSRWLLQIVSTPEWHAGPWEIDPPNNGDFARIRPTDTSGSFNNYNPTGLATAILVEFEPSATLTLTGLTNTGKRQILWLRNRDSGSGNVVLVHQSTSSTTTNRFRCPLSQDYVIRAGEGVLLLYDLSSNRWVFLSASPYSGTASTIYNVQYDSVNNQFILPGSGTLPIRPVLTATVQVTHAQLVALNTTPVLLIAAPPSSTQLIQVLRSTFYGKQTVGSSGSYTASLRYVGTTTPVSNQGGLINAARTLINTISGPIALNQTSGATGYFGVGIELGTTLTPPTGGAGTYQYTLEYIITDIVI